MANKLYHNTLGPTFTYLLAVLLFVLSLPLMLVISFMLAVSNKGKFLFIQQRVGLNEKPFKLYKFISLNDSRGVDGNLLPDDERLFLLGSFLRRYHLDELPQLFNVLKGDLCFVGPRPLLMEYLPYYTPKQRARHTCKPGLTGLSQVLGGNRLTWQQRLRLDSFYAEHRCLALDLIITWRSLKLVFGGKVGNKKAMFSKSFIEPHMHGTQAA